MARFLLFGFKVLFFCVKRSARSVTLAESCSSSCYLFPFGTFSAVDVISPKPPTLCAFGRFLNSEHAALDTLEFVQRIFPQTLWRDSWESRFACSRQL